MIIERAEFSKRPRKSIKRKMRISSHRKKERTLACTVGKTGGEEDGDRERKNRCGSITWEIYVENIKRNRGKGVKERDQRTDMYDNSVNTSLIAIYY